MSAKPMLSLRDRVRSIESTGVLEPAKISALILHDLHGDMDAVESALQAALPSFVHQMQTTQRKSIEVQANTIASAHSGKVAAIRGMYGVLDVVIPLPGGAKRLGDCVRADLIEYAGALREHAARTVRKADWYEQVANKLPDGETTVRDAHIDFREAA